MNKTDLEKVLDRSEHSYLLQNSNFKQLKGKKILITGGSGSIGLRTKERLDQIGALVTSTDKETLDITNKELVKEFFKNNKFEYILHLAGAKHAPEGEVKVFETININTIGVLNILEHKGDAKFILTSTCKSCNPETVYGASKLIAERLVINSGGSIARFYNVVETQGNVFEIWKDEKVIYVSVICDRYFISLDESVGLLLYSALNEGRYSVNVDDIQNMSLVAQRLHSGKKEMRICQPRKGDRVKELKCSTNEVIEVINEAIIKVNNYFDL